MVRRVWKDRIVERPRTYEKIENPDGTITLTPSPGQVIQEGTPVNAENMNNIEQGIEDTQARVDTVQQDLAAHKAEKANPTELGHIKGNTDADGKLKADSVNLIDTANNFTNKNVEGALNELFTNVSDGKSLVGGAITGVDNNVVIPTNPSFNDLASAIGQISTGEDISNVLPGNTLLYYRERTNYIDFPNYNEWIVAYSVECRFSGTVRVRYSGQQYGGTYITSFYSSIFVNDEMVGIERMINSQTETTFTEDVSISAGDTLSIQIKSLSSNKRGRVPKFELLADRSIYIN